VLATRGGGDGGVGAGGGKLTMMDKAQFLSLRDATAQPPETLKTVMHAALGETNTSGFPANPHFLRSSRDLISSASNLLKRIFFFRTKILTFRTKSSCPWRMIFRPLFRQKFTLDECKPPYTSLSSCFTGCTIDPKVSRGTLSNVARDGKWNAGWYWEWRRKSRTE